MRRSTLIGGMTAALLVGWTACSAPTYADEPPAQPPTQAEPPAAVPPATAGAAPAGAVQTPPPSAPQTTSPATAAQTTPPPAAQSPSEGVAASSPNTTPPNAPPSSPPSVVQSVAPEDAEAILGQRVTDPDGKEIGRLVDVLVDASGQPQAAIIDFGGFMGVGNRKIAVHWSALRFAPADPKHKVALEMTPDQIKTAPEFRNPNKAAAVVTPAEPAPSSP